MGSISSLHGPSDHTGRKAKCPRSPVWNPVPLRTGNRGEVMTADPLLGTRWTNRIGCCRHDRTMKFLRLLGTWWFLRRDRQCRALIVKYHRANSTYRRYVLAHHKKFRWYNPPNRLLAWPLRRLKDNGANGNSSRTYRDNKCQSIRRKLSCSHTW